MNDENAVPGRDVTVTYSTRQTIEKLERLIAALRDGQSFEIQVDNQSVRVPAGTRLSVEHEQEGPIHELEFQLRWRDDE